MLKCAPCTDKAIASGEPVEAGNIPEAFTTVAFAQVFTVSTPQGPQSVIGVSATPVCLACRQEQLAQPSTTGRLLQV